MKYFKYYYFKNYSYSYYTTNFKQFVYPKPQGILMYSIYCIIHINKNLKIQNQKYQLNNYIDLSIWNYMLILIFMNLFHSINFHLSYNMN